MEQSTQEVTQHEQANPGLQDSTDGQDEGTTGQALVADSETFFDPSDITDPGLLSQYKQMQAAFTRKMQGVSQQSNDARDKIQQYDAFMADPVNTIQRIASQYGLSVSRGQAQHQQSDFQQGDPKNWDDVYSNAAKTAEQRVMEKMQPLLNDIQSTKKTQIETYLDQNAPDWRQYEDTMTELVTKHPTLSNDPLRLYEMSVPQSVREQRATQAALKKLKQAAHSNNLSGGTTTAPAQKTPQKASSFDEAVAMAREQLANKGR